MHQLPTSSVQLLGRRRIVSLAVAALLTAAAPGAQQSPDRTRAMLKPAPGLEVTLWASEPMLAKPTNLTVDERGRVWVLEAANYRRASRKQPDLRPDGDRIVILEDADHDGRAEKVKVFDQNPQIRAPLGIAVLGDKVYVSQSPDLIVYTKDGSDAIVKKEVLLTGFGGIDHDHGLHAVVFGPDGKLYFNQGNTGLDVTDRSGTRIFTQGTGANTRPGVGFFEGVALRVNPDGTGLEVLGQNFRNPYEVAVDSFGNVFQTDNDDDGNAWTRLLYNMEGGNYGFRGPLNKTWLEDRGTHWHMELPGVAPPVLRLGAGSPCGLAVYEGALLPARYRGQILHAEAGKRIVAGYQLRDDGAGLAATSEDLVNGGDDTWSRPSDVAVAPDGAVFIADWYDPGVGGHLMGDQEQRGRIYRVAPAGNTPRSTTLDLTSNAGLSLAFASPNPAVQYLAYSAIKAQGPAAVPLLQTMWRQNNAVLKARALWLLGGLGGSGSAAIQEALRHDDARFRILGLRVARLHGADVLATAARLLRDPSPQVRREIALMLRDPSRMLPAYLYAEQAVPPGPWLDAMSQLASGYDGKDRWYLEALGIAARGREDALYARLKADHTAKPNPAFAQLVWEIRPRTALPDLIAVMTDASAPVAARSMALDTLGAMQWPDAARAVEALILDPSSPPALVQRAFGLYGRQLSSLWTESRDSAQFAAVVRKALTLPGAQSAAVAVTDVLGDGRFLPDLLQLAKSEAAPEVRAAALETMAAVGGAQLAGEFQALAATGPVPVRAAAVRALAGLRQASLEPWAEQIVVSDAPNEVRTEALRLLGGSATGLNTILDLAERKSLPLELRTLARNITNYATPPPATAPRRGAAQSPVAIRQRAALTDPAYLAIRARAATLLPLPAAKTIPSVVELEFSYSGKAPDGRRTFETDAGCAACHGLGGPKKLGPDLSAIGAKYGKQAMLDHILRPSDAIGPEYVTSVLTLKSGGQVMGLITEETPDRITVQTAADQQQRLKPSEVASRQQSRASSMPEGLLDPLSLQQVADLLEFLSTLK